MYPCRPFGGGVGRGGQPCPSCEIVWGLLIFCVLCLPALFR